MLNEIKENTNRKLNEIRKMMHKQYENVNKEIETMKKNQTEILELKNTKVWKNSSEEFNIRLDKAKERISELEDKSFEITESEAQKEKKRMKKSKENIRYLLDTIQRTNIHIRDSQNKREKWAEILLEEIMAKLSKSEEINGHTDSRS